MWNYIKASLFSGLAFALISCGGGGGSTAPATGSNVTPPAPTPTGDSFDIQGTAIKGTVKNGYVSVVDAHNVSNVLASARTSSTDGSYTISVPASANFTGDFIKIIVKGGTDAMMTCDVAPGCGEDVAFGTDFTIGDDVSISSIIASPGDNGSDIVNISAMTTLATTLAEAQENLTNDILLGSNQKIADLFALSSHELESLSAIDITEASSSVTDRDSIRAAMINAGIMGAIMGLELDLGTSLSALGTDLASHNGQLYHGDGQPGSGVGMASILEAAVEAGEASPIISPMLNAEASILIVDYLTSYNRDQGQLTDALPSPNVGETDLDKAKAFVSDLQLINAAIDNENSSADIEAFAEDIEQASQLLVRENAGPLLSLVSALEKVNIAFGRYEDNPNLITAIADDVTVHISEENKAVRFKINQTEIEGSMVDLDVLISDSFILDETSTNRQNDSGTFWFNLDEITLSGDGEISFTASVMNDDISMDISKGAITVKNLQALVFEKDYYRYKVRDSFQNSAFEEHVTVSFGEVNIDMAMQVQEMGSSGVRFNGFGTVDMMNGAYDGTSLTTEWFTETDLEAMLHGDRFSSGFDMTNLSLNGKFSNTDNQANVTVVLDAQGTDFTVNSEWTSVPTVSYTFDDNVITFDESEEIHGGSNYTYEMTTYEEAQAEYLAIINDSSDELDSFYLSNSGALGNATIIWEELSYEDEEGWKHRTYWMSEEGETEYTPSQPILRQTFTLYGAAETLTRFMTMKAFSIGYRVDDILSDEFITTPPMNTIEFYNQSRNLEGTGTSFCLDSGQYIVGVYNELSEAGGQLYSGYVAETFSDRDVCLAAEGEGLYATINTSMSVSDGALLDMNFAASIYQDVVGIDPEHPEVELSLYGPAMIEDGELSGDMSVALSFAGRRYQTDARSFDILDDFSKTMTITNQDDVVLTLIRDENDGLKGELIKDGVILAILSEDSGVPIFTFSDDSFVSIQ